MLPVTDIAKLAGLFFLVFSLVFFFPASCVGVSAAEIESKAIAAFEEGKYTEAEALYLSLESIKGSCKDSARINRAVCLHAKNKCEEAKEILYSVRASGNYKASLRLAVCLRESGDYQEALTCALEAPIESGKLEEVADLLHATGMDEQACFFYAKLLNEDPVSLYNLAAASTDAGYSMRDTCAELILKTEPDDALWPYVLRLSIVFWPEVASDLQAELDFCEEGS